MDTAHRWWVGGGGFAGAGTFTEYKPNERLVISTSAVEGFEGEQTYELVSLGDGRSRLDIRGQFRFHLWFAKLLKPLIMPSAKKKLAGDLTRLKSLAEGARASGAAAR